MPCLFDHLTLVTSFLGGVGCALLVLCAVLYIFATYAPLDARRNDPGA